MHVRSTYAWPTMLAWSVHACTVMHACGCAQWQPLRMLSNCVLERLPLYSMCTLCVHSCCKHLTHKK